MKTGFMVPKGLNAQRSNEGLQGLSLSSQFKRMQIKSRSLRGIAVTAILWILIGVPVAALICSTQMYIWIVAVIPKMAGTAAVLGLAQGIWLQVVGQFVDSKSHKSLLLGSTSGAVLGLLGFPPVYSHTEIAVEEITAGGFITFVMAALIGGIAAGIASAALVALPKRSEPSPSRILLITSGLLVPLILVEYEFYWQGMTERLPIKAVSKREIANLSAGSARGSLWSGCYLYGGHTPLKHGGEGGYLIVMQHDGYLNVLGRPEQRLRGGVDANGNFRFGSETIYGHDTLREVWSGTFRKNSFDYVHRSTSLDRKGEVTKERITGIGRRARCPL